MARVAPVLLPDRDEKTVCGGGTKVNQVWAGARGSRPDRRARGRKGRLTAMRVAALVVPLCACILAAPCAGCTVGFEGPPVTTTVAAGTLTITWLVAGRSDPSLCAAYGASALELVVYDEAGAEVTTVNAPCESSSLTVTLPEGTYTAEATLVDAVSRARSTTKAITTFDVVAGTDLAISLDFPASSML
jgi:hypothetical protein